ncbi:dATP/dGTP pyrophosphohydrolase [Maribacter phage Panino]
MNEDLGKRYNSGKRRWSLVDFQSLEPMVEVLEFGATKYDDHNWKKGLKTTEIAESLLRHLVAFLNGEDNDPESGLSHIGHIQCNAMFLSYMMENKPEMDTRYSKNK